MSRAKTRTFRNLLKVANYIVDEQKKEIRKLSLEVLFFIKKSMRLEDENKKLKEKLREWIAEAERDKKHLGMIHLMQETEELLGGEIK